MHLYWTFLLIQHSADRPVLQCFPPANIRALDMDHAYTEMSLSEAFLATCGVSPISNDSVVEIEAATRGQASNRRWFQERSLRITASHFGEICRATERRDKAKLAMSITKPTQITTPSLQHGHRYESVAVEKVARECKVNPNECGLFVCEEYPFLAASPDRIIDEDVIIEVKCPFASKDKPITPSTVPYLQSISDGDELVLDSKHVYYYQVQGQLLCSGRQKCLFVVYTLVDMKVITIHYDINFARNMVQRLFEFYDQYFRQAVIETHLYRGFDAYSCVFHNEQQLNN